MGFLSSTHAKTLFRGTVHWSILVNLPSRLLRTGGFVSPSRFYDHLVFSSISCPSCYHKHLHKELRFLSHLPFSHRESKAWTEEHFDETARKTAFPHWHFGNIALVVWDPFVSTASIHLCFMAFDFCCFNSVFGFAPLGPCSCQLGSVFTDLLYLTSLPLWILHPI